MYLPSSLLMSADSTVLDTMTCTNSVNDATYTFYIERMPKNYIIKAEHEDFETTYVNLPIQRIARNLNFNAPWHYMKRSDRRKADKEMGLKDTQYVTLVQCVGYPDKED